MAHIVDNDTKARENGAAEDEKPSSCVCCKSQPVRCRGLCEYCYKSALYQIAIGNTTNEELEQNHLILPAKRLMAMRKAIEAIRDSERSAKSVKSDGS